MTDFKIISDSACALAPDLVSQYNIQIVPFYISLDGVNYEKELLGSNLDIFYKTLKTKKIFPKTSLPSIQDYCDVFRNYLEQKLDILCICITSKFSGSYQSAVNARNILKDEFPQHTISVIDSRTVSLHQGILAISAAKMKEEGMSLTHTTQAIEKMKLNGSIILTVDSLEYLEQGGRIGKVSAFAGGLLNIKPVINMGDGELIPLSKVRGRKKAVSKIIELLLEETQGNQQQFEYFVLHSDAKEESLELEKTLRNEFNIHLTIPPGDLGGLIGAHIGPTGLGVGYQKKYKFM